MERKYNGTENQYKAKAIVRGAKSNSRKNVGKQLKRVPSCSFEMVISIFRGILKVSLGKDPSYTTLATTYFGT